MDELTLTSTETLPEASETGCYLLEKGSNQGSNLLSKVATPKQAFSGKGSNLDGEEIWLSRGEVESLMGVSHEAVKKACRTGRFTTILVTGNGGKQYRIALSSLPPEAQKKWAQENPEQAAALPPHIKEKIAPQAQLEITRITAPKEAAGMDTLIDGHDNESFELTLKALNPPTGWKKTAWIIKCGEDAGRSRQTISGYIKGYKEQGVAFFSLTREKKGATSWDPEALEYMSGVYLKAVREGGDSSKRFAHKAVVAEAQKQGWRTGSESSAYTHLGKLNHLLERYARGGTRELDNIFYILRQYSDLDPFEFIVGDQHRFDFWVHDREIDRIFRMEGFFWVDLRSRIPYGWAITDRYNSYLIGLALRMGLKRFGKFRNVYTDNGRPEISKYTHSILNDLRVYGMNTCDIAELYKTENGYAVEGEEGEVIDVVPTAQAWHRRARPYNAKAKLIERFFRTLESILVKDLSVPGLVKNLRAGNEEAALADKRLKKLKEEGSLLSPEEFTLKVMEAMELYTHRRHATLRKSPFDELMAAVKEGGFTPRMVIETELDFILMAREQRSVQRGRIQINNTQYQGLSLDHGLWDIVDGTKVEVRYDQYSDNVIAVRPDGSAVQLVEVQRSSMKDPKLTGELMEWKKACIKKIKDEFKKLTQPIPGFIEYSTHTKAALNLKKAVKKELPKLTEEQYREGVDRLVAESSGVGQGARGKGQGLMLTEPVFGSEVDRYKFWVNAVLDGHELPERAQNFMSQYEVRMDESEKIYWGEYRRMNQRKKTVNRES